MKSRMEKTVKGIELSVKGEKMGWIFTQAFNSATKCKTWDVYSRLFVKEPRFVREGEE